MVPNQNLIYIHYSLQDFVHVWVTIWNKNLTQVEVLSKYNVRLVVNSSEKKTFFTEKRSHLLALKAVKAVNFCKICGF